MMDKAKSLEFLQNCIDNMNKMTSSEIERMKQIYNTPKYEEASATFIECMAA